MKKIKFPLVLSVVIFAVCCAVAFTPAPKKAGVSHSITETYFELVTNGNKLTRTDWVTSTADADCPTYHTSMPCRILADASGSNPSIASFNNILSNSSDFEIAYPDKVTFFEE